MRSLFFCFVFVDTLDAFAEHLLHVLRMIMDIDTKRPKIKIWFPGRLSKVKDDISNAEFKDTAGASMGTATDPTSFDSSSNSNTSDLGQEDGDEEDLYEPPGTPSLICLFTRSLTMFLTYA